LLRLLVQGLQRVAPADDLPQFRAGAQAQGAVVLDDVAQGHFLDEGQVDAATAHEFHQLRHLVVIASLEYHRVDLDPIETRADSRVDACNDLVQVAVPGEVAKLARIQAVQADIDTFYPALPQRHGQSLQSHPQLGERLCHLLQLLQGQYLPLRHEHHFLRHAVHATEIATVGDGQADIVDPPLEAVNQYGRELLTHGFQFRPLRSQVPAPTLQRWMGGTGCVC
jgi:hypothetical protein